MKRIFITALAVATFWQVKAADATWLTDLPTAQAQARTESKLVLMDFNGSDWCPDCIALKKRVLDTKRFQAYAITNLVLVDVDFPDKKPQSSDLKRANDALKSKYQVEGLPALIVLDSGGKEVGRLSSSEEESDRTSFDGSLDAGT